MFTNYLIRAKLGGVLESRKIPDGGHVLVCGLGNVGFRCVQELLRLGHQVAAIDKDANTPFADTEERSKVAFARRIQDDASAELGVGDPLAGSELRLVCHATASGDPKVEQA